MLKNWMKTLFLHIDNVATHGLLCIIEMCNKSIKYAR